MDQKLNLFICALLCAIIQAKSKTIRHSCDSSLQDTCLIEDLTLREDDRLEITDAQKIMITVAIRNSRLPCFPCNIDKFFELIQFLNISNSTIKKFSLNDLEGFTNLKNVSLDGNNITEFETKSGNSIGIYLKNNNIMFDSNSISSSNTTKFFMIIIVLVILLIGTNAALLIKIRKNLQITTNFNSDTVVTRKSTKT
ncbi:hypothetical protein ACKWTF_014173 [Chironomus riparius]